MRLENKLQGIVANYMPEQGVAFYKWEDDPFVVTVTASKTARGYITDWWISGLTWSDFHNDDTGGTPKLMIRAQLGMSKKKTAHELELTLQGIWLDSLKELAFGSAVHGGIEKIEVGVDSSLKQLHAEHHLEGHDRLGHFDSAISESPVTERSARQYGLLTSIGYPKAQKLIAEFETTRQAIEVLVGAIDRRLYMGRKLGMIPKKQLDTPFFSESK